MPGLRALATAASGRRPVSAWRCSRRGTPAILQQSEAFYDRRGAATVFLGRWLPILRFTAVLLAGANRMPWPRFLLWNALGGTCWAISVGMLAYILGSQAGSAIEAIGAVGLIMLILIILSHIAWRHLRPTSDTDTSQ